ncbi:MAG: HAD family hydrolase [Tepidisphaerales bacterium]
MALELVIFDMSGTVVFDRDAVFSAMQEAVSAITGHSLGREQCKRVMGIDQQVALSHLVAECRGGHAPEADELAHALKIFRRRVLSRYEFDPSVCEMPGASDAFRQLHAWGIRAALNAAFDRELTNTLIDRFGWDRDGLIDASLASDEVGASRPSSDAIQALLELSGVKSPASVMKVGDAPIGLEEGDAADCRWLIGVTTGAHSFAELSRHPHTAILRGVADLPAWMAEHILSLNKETQGEPCGSPCLPIEHSCAGV